MNNNNIIMTKKIISKKIKTKKRNFLNKKKFVFKL